MAQVNRGPVRTRHKTHEGGKAYVGSPLEQLQRSTMACLLWEDGFYESGVHIGQRIHDLVGQVPVRQNDDLIKLIKTTRTEQNLRHVGLWVIVAMFEHGRAMNAKLAMYHGIQRPDEMMELLALWWRDGKRGLPHQMKLGFLELLESNRWDDYQLIKWRGENKDIKLRDVLRLIHPKPTPEREKVFGQIIEGTAKTNATWEARLSSGENKREVFEDLLNRKKLGYMALLRNLRNMQEAGVANHLIQEALMIGNAERVLPFRFVSAAKHAPDFIRALETAMLRCVETQTKSSGRTVLLVDVSTSMTWEKVSSKSTLERWEAAAALAMLAAEKYPDASLYFFTYTARKAKLYRGFAMIDQVRREIGGGTNIGGAVMSVLEQEKCPVARIIVFTDEQSNSPVPALRSPMAGYLINVASHENSVSAGQGWTRITGFSERVLDYIDAVEEV